MINLGNTAVFDPMDEGYAGGGEESCQVVGTVPAKGARSAVKPT